MKVERDINREQKLRAVIERMPEDIARPVRKVCQDRGLLPGGGKDEDEHGGEDQERG